MRILLARHGESSHNLQKHVFMGRSSASQLTDKGRYQAQCLGNLVKDLGYKPLIIASSLRRTVETANIVAECLGTDKPQLDDAFWELSKGDWEGKMPVPLADDIAQQIAADPFNFVYGEGGESYKMVFERVSAAFLKWIKKSEGHGELLFVLHGDVLRTLFHYLLKTPPEAIQNIVTDPCSLHSFIKNNRGFVTEYINALPYSRRELLE